MQKNKRLCNAIETMNLKTEGVCANRHWQEKRKKNVKKCTKQYSTTTNGQARYFVRTIFTMLLQCPDFISTFNTKNIMGYELKAMKEHIEKQFDDKMNWSNYGLKGWHIDHIIPVSKFNIQKLGDKEFKSCWALDNLRPLWAKENLKKGANRL